MKIQILGAGREIGGSGILVMHEKTNIVMDYGLKVQPRPPSPPMPVNNVNAVFLTHSHLDHCGSIPLLYKQEDPVFFTNDITLESVNMLIEDSFKIAKREKNILPFGKQEVRKMNLNSKFLDYNEAVKVNDFSCNLFDAGHIPGSASIFLEHSTGKKIFYTGDIRLDDSRLLRGATLPKNTDVLITETTYSEKDHPHRQEEEKKIIENIEEAISINEPVLIPVFAIGRSQEILLILEKYADQIAFDGMAKSASEILLRYQKYVKDAKKLRKILDTITWIRSEQEREIASQKFPIIVTTAAMMSGGPILYYLRQLKDRKEAKILFVGFLVEDTPGRNLLETGFFKKAEDKYRVHCDVQQFDLSSHAGRSELFEIIKKTNPEKVITVHGENCEKFALDVKEKFGIKAYAPKNGDIIKV